MNIDSCVFTGGYGVLHECLTLMCGCKIGDVCFPVCSMKLKIWVKNELNCQFRHYFHSCPHVVCICIYGWWLLSGGGGASAPPPLSPSLHPPLNETLLATMYVSLTLFSILTCSYTAANCLPLLCSSNTGYMTQTQ